MELSIDWSFKRAVKEARLTLTLLEKATGINRALLSMYSNGKYNLNLIQRRKIARAMGKPEEEIFDQRKKDGAQSRC
jgi:transcriptional regulator with XRE-family HTH domain